MANFLFSEANVRKNYFRIFVKTFENIALHPVEPSVLTGNACGVDNTTAGQGIAGLPGNSTGFFNALYSNYYEQVGSCKAEPKISSADVEGLKNNIGTSLGASKEVSVEFALIDLDGGTVTQGNYLSTIGLEGKAANIIFFDENSGVVHYVRGVVSSVNLASTGNGFEELPVIAKKEAATIGAVANRFKFNPGASAAVTEGAVATVSIYSAGLGYAATDDGLIQKQLISAGSGSGFIADIATVGALGVVTAVTINTPGTLYRVGDLIVLDDGVASTKQLIVRVETIA